MALFRDDPQDELFLIENPGADKKEGTRIEQFRGECYTQSR